MRAFASPSPKSPLVLTELPKPTPGPGEILLRLGAASINPFDWKLLDLANEGTIPHVFPFIVGVDGAGVVEAVGSGVTSAKVGDGLYGQMFHPPAGRGTYAEYIVVPDSLPLAPIPRGIYTTQAAAVPTAGMTALAALDAMQLAKGQTLAIFGAKGGVGSFATQLAANAGVLVVALSRGDHGTYLRKFGAFEYRDSGRLGYENEFRFAYPKGVDGVLDLAHPAVPAPETLALVRDGGVFASPRAPPDWPSEGPRGIRQVRVDLHPERSLLDRLGTELLSGRLRVPVEMQVPLAEVGVAFETNRAGGTRGKCVVQI